MNDIQVRNIVKEEIVAAFDKFEAKIMYYFDRVFQDIGTVEGKVEGFDGKFNSLQNEMNGIQGKMKNLETKVDSIYEEQLTQKLSIVNIENTLNGYGDMYTLNNEKIEKLNERVYKIEKKSGQMILHDK